MSNLPHPPRRGALATGLLLVAAAAVWVPRVEAQAGLGPTREADAQAREVEERCGVRVVSASELEGVIRSLGGYDLTAAPNQGRFFSDVLLALAEGRPDDEPPFLVRQEEFFPAFLRATGLSAREAPPNLRWMAGVRQWVLAEHRPGRVIASTGDGPRPRQALSVRVDWADTAGIPSSYTYEDTLSSPHVRIRHERGQSYRLLQFDSMVVFTEMEGISGRPTTGALGALFTVLGMARLEETRFAVARDGTQVTRTQVRRLLSRTVLATVSPEGRAERGIPDDEPELRGLAELVERELEIVYAREPPPVCPDEPRVWPG